MTMSFIESPNSLRIARSALVDVHIHGLDWLRKICTVASVRKRLARRPLNLRATPS